MRPNGYEGISDRPEQFRQFRRRRKPALHNLNRMHYTRAGISKWSYTEEQAIEAAARLNEPGRKKWMAHAEHYECECGAWHVGNVYEQWNKAGKSDYHAIALELGDRVAMCMMVENMGPPRARVQQLIGRGEAAVRKRLQEHPTPPRPDRWLP